MSIIFSLLPLLCNFILKLQSNLSVNPASVRCICRQYKIIFFFYQFIQVLIYRFWRIHIAINIDISAPVKCHYTIEELSKQYLMNTTTLKSVFKAVYGMPIASYMKEYHMKLASNMLLQEDKSISEIATAVGYKSQSKFTSAFRDIFQILPTAYQKLYRNQQF